MLGLKIMRIKAHLTQEQLAKELNISLRQIRNYEQGQRSPKLETLKAMAAFFECTIDELL